RLLVPAEGKARERGVRAVDPDRARLDLARQPVAAGGIARPDRCNKAVLDVVREPDRFGLVLEWDDRDDGPEDLLLRDAHRVVDLREHRRRVKGAVAVERMSPGDDLDA